MYAITRNAPNKARSRPVEGTGRLLNCQLGGDNEGSNTTLLRLQRLAEVAGVIGYRANVLADLAWGEAA